MRTRSTAGVIIVVLFAMSHGLAAEKDEFKATCPVSGKPASKNFSVKYKGKTLCFACEKCGETFKKNRKPYVVKANRQLVETGQAVQVGCPTCGREITPDITLEVGGVKIMFGCIGSKGRVEAESGDKRLAAVFGNRPFGIAFTLQTKCVVCGEPIDPKCSTEYKDQRVYFCSANCKRAFEKSPEKFAKKLAKPK
jgi:YHS domain-containing protein